MYNDELNSSRQLVNRYAQSCLASNGPLILNRGFSKNVNITTKCYTSNINNGPCSISFWDKPFIWFFKKLIWSWIYFTVTVLRDLCLHIWNIKFNDIYWCYIAIWVQIRSKKWKLNWTLSHCCDWVKKQYSLDKRLRSCYLLFVNIYTSAS